MGNGPPPECRLHGKATTAFSLHCQISAQQVPELTDLICLPSSLQHRLRHHLPHKLNMKKTSHMA